MKLDKIKKFILPTFAIITVVAVIIINISSPKNNTSKEDDTFSKVISQPKVIEATVNENGDLLINKVDISTEVSFIGYTLNNTYMELLATKTKDGTIKFALNTCSVCNGSPRAYFVKSGNKILCQNCRNKFDFTEIGETSDGCSPIALSKSDIQLDNNTIIIKNNYLEKNIKKFKGWKI